MLLECISAATSATASGDRVDNERAVVKQTHDLTTTTLILAFPCYTDNKSSGQQDDEGDLRPNASDNVGCNSSNPTNWRQYQNSFWKSWSQSQRNQAKRGERSSTERCASGTKKQGLSTLRIRHGGVNHQDKHGEHRSAEKTVTVAVTSWSDCGTLFVASTWCPLAKTDQIDNADELVLIELKRIYLSESA